MGRLERKWGALIRGIKEAVSAQVAINLRLISFLLSNKYKMRMFSCRLQKTSLQVGGNPPSYSCSQ